MEQFVRNLAGAVVVTAMVLGAGTSAAQSLLPNFKWDIQPTPGGYYDPAQPGTGVMVDTLAQGNGAPFVFLAYYHYEPNGQADWLTMGATVTQATMAEYTATGVPAQIRSQWIRSVGGQCLDCAYLAPSTALVPGERILNLVGGRHIEFPAAGNATLQRMKMAKDFGTTGSISRTLLDSGIVWAARSRSYFDGTERIFNAGWIRLRQRTASLSQITTMTPPNAVVPVPPHLSSLGTHNQGPQWEAQCVREDSGSGSAIGGCSIDIIDGGTATMADANNIAFTIDLAGERIRYTERCINPPCIPLDPSHADRVGELIEIAPAPDGRRRLVLRIFGAASGGWRREIELTQVGADLLAATFPNGVPQ